ncbi:MAG: GNAT family N-acetyltransferase [Myxococcota bacterium]
MKPTPAMKPKIRALRPDDRTTWQTLWTGYLDFYRVTLPPEVTNGTWDRLVDAEVDIHGLVAEGPATGQVVGIVHFLFHPVTWSAAPRCYLEDLFVSDQARRTGAGRALIEAVYDAADARQADQVYWLTEEGNHVARRLYDQVGQHTPFIKYRR